MEAHFVPRRRRPAFVARRIMVLILVVGVGTLMSVPTGVSAFTATSTATSNTSKKLAPFGANALHQFFKHPCPSSSHCLPGCHSSSSGGALFMSDVPQDDDQQNKKKKSMRRQHQQKQQLVQQQQQQQHYWWKLPPTPEDQFVLIGDLLSLAVYSISDHVVCQIMSQQMIPAESHQIYTDMVVDAHAAWQAPVWWEAASPQSTAVLQATLESHVVTRYSPLLEPMGQATVLLAAAWLLAGWFHRAFLYQNTLDCSTERVLAVTARTWLSTCAILASLVVATQALSGMEDWATNFCRGDVDYVVDSLTVLTVWRFMASWLLGGGNK